MSFRQPAVLRTGCKEEGTHLGPRAERAWPWPTWTLAMATRPSAPPSLHAPPQGGAARERQGHTCP